MVHMIVFGSGFRSNEDLHHAVIRERRQGLGFRFSGPVALRISAS